MNTWPGPKLRACYKHVMPEKISSRLGPPPLYARPMLSQLANIIHLRRSKATLPLRKSSTLLCQRAESTGLCNRRKVCQKNRCFRNGPHAGRKKNAEIQAAGGIRRQIGQDTRKICGRHGSTLTTILSFNRRLEALQAFIGIRKVHYHVP